MEVILLGAAFRGNASISVRYLTIVPPGWSATLYALPLPQSASCAVARVPGGCDCFDAWVVYHRCPRRLHQSLADRLVGSQSGWGLAGVFRWHPCRCTTSWAERLMWETKKPLSAAPR